MRAWAVVAAISWWRTQVNHGTAVLRLLDSHRCRDKQLVEALPVDSDSGGSKTIADQFTLHGLSTVDRQIHTVRLGGIRVTSHMDSREAVGLRRLHSFRDDCLSSFGHASANVTIPALSPR